MNDLGTASFLADYELKTTFTHGGVSYAGAIGDVTQSLDLGDGGYSGAADQVLVASAAQFTTAPASGESVVVGSVTLRIRERTKSPCGTFYVFNLTDPTRGV